MASLHNFNKFLLISLFFYLTA